VNTTQPRPIQPLINPDQSLSLNRIVAALQVVLATRRAARTEQYAYQYALVRAR
jgi:hypothetical protein